MGDSAEPTTPAAAEESKPTVPSAPSPAEDWATQYKYLLADFENYRKRTERERENSHARLRGTLIKGLLPIYEAFERARETAGAPGPTSDALRRGLDLLEVEWQRFLKEEGVAPVTAVGQPFAPEEEEALAKVPLTERAPDGTVAEIVQQGYRFRGGLLRPAKVVVARSPVPGPGSAADSANDEPPASGGTR